MNSIEELKQQLLLQKQAIESLGGRVNVAGTNPSPAEITAGIKTITSTQTASISAFSLKTGAKPTPFTAEDELALMQQMETELEQQINQTNQIHINNQEESSTEKLVEPETNISEAETSNQTQQNTTETTSLSQEETPSILAATNSKTSPIQEAQPIQEPCSENQPALSSTNSESNQLEGQLTLFDNN